MKTKLLLFCMCSFLSQNIYSQSVHVSTIIATPDGKQEVDISQGKDITVDKKTKLLKSLTIKCKDLPADHSLKVTAVSETQEYKTSGEEKKMDFSTDLLNKEIKIQHFDKAGAEVASDQVKFRFIPEAEADPKEGDGGNLKEEEPSIDAYLEKTYSGLEATPFGFIDPAEKNGEIHIFFDQFGNSLKSTIPQGISNAQYVVHIIYPFSLSDPNKISYSIKQKSGSFSSALLFNNSNIRSQIPGQLQSGEKYDGIIERKFLLSTSTDDLVFDIIAASKESKVTKTVLESYTIKMSPVYHGSFDVGLIRTTLSNPSFSLVQFPNSSYEVVKETDKSPKGVVTVMASFYASPVLILESIFGKKRIPFYKLTGRSFLDDHKIYERIYPTIGVGVTDKSFENIFYGLNWEIARGLCIFYGFHTGKVNTFEMPSFQPEVTPVTNDEFEFYKNTKWKTSKTIGVKLDIIIIRNLFQTMSAQ